MIREEPKKRLIAILDCNEAPSGGWLYRAAAVGRRFSANTDARPIRYGAGGWFYRAAAVVTDTVSRR